MGWAVKARKLDKRKHIAPFLLVKRLLALIATTLRVGHANAPTRGYGPPRGSLWALLLPIPGAYTHCGTRHGWAVKARKGNKLSTIIFLLVERLLALIATILRVGCPSTPTSGYRPPRGSE